MTFSIFEINDKKGNILSALEFSKHIFMERNLEKGKKY